MILTWKISRRLKLNNIKQDLLQKITKLEEKIQDSERQISIAQQQKNYYEKQFLKISRELSNFIIFQKAKSEIKDIPIPSEIIEGVKVQWNQTSTA